jgi:pimeloyl-ACP methyl ester carboxylesterase
MGLALVVALSWLIARLWCAPKRRLPTKGPGDYGLRYEPISFRSNDIIIRGWFIPSVSEPEPAPTVILAHGWSGNAADMLPAARVLHNAGFAVAVYDARGHGLSGNDGPITILKFAEDLRACLDYLSTRADIDRGHIGLLGHSLGGSAALLVASADPRVRALVSCSAFSDPRTITEDFLRRAHVPVWPFLKLVCRHIERWMGISMEAVAPKRRIGQIRVPLLLLHGESDRFIPPAHMETLYAMADHDRTDIRNLPNRRHADVTKDARCGEEIVAFFVNHLSTAPAAAPPARRELSRQ